MTIAAIRGLKVNPTLLNKHAVQGDWGGGGVGLTPPYRVSMQYRGISGGGEGVYVLFVYYSCRVSHCSWSITFIHYGML